MTNELKEIVDLLIANGHWCALDDICREYGSEVDAYVRADEDCPW